MLGKSIKLISLRGSPGLVFHSTACHGQGFNSTLESVVLGGWQSHRTRSVRRGPLQRFTRREPFRWITGLKPGKRNKSSCQVEVSLSCMLPKVNTKDARSRKHIKSNQVSLLGVLPALHLLVAKEHLPAATKRNAKIVAEYPMCSATCRPVSTEPRTISRNSRTANSPLETSGSLMVSTKISCFPGLASPYNSTIRVPQASAMICIKLLAARDSHVAQPLGTCAVLPEFPGSYVGRGPACSPRSVPAETCLGGVLGSESLVAVFETTPGRPNTKFTHSVHASKAKYNTIDKRSQCGLVIRVSSLMST